MEHRNIKVKDATLKGLTLFIYTAIATPILLVVAIFFMGGGHGSYFIGKLFFPTSMIIAGIKEQITDLAFYLAIIQTPIYGLIIFFFRKSNWKLASLCLLLIHIILFMIAINLESSFN